MQSLRVLSLIVFIVIASNPALINEDLIPYMANLLEISLSSVDNFIRLGGMDCRRDALSLLR